MTHHGFGRNAARPRKSSLAKWLRECDQANAPKGVWDERTKAWIKPSGTVKQGRRPMFEPTMTAEQYNSELALLREEATNAGLRIKTFVLLKYGTGVTVPEAIDRRVTKSKLPSLPI